MDFNFRQSLKYEHNASRAVVSDAWRADQFKCVMSSNTLTATSFALCNLLSCIWLYLYMYICLWAVMAFCINKVSYRIVNHSGVN